MLLDGFLVGALSLKMLQSSKEKWKQMLTDIKSKVAAKHLQSESILSYKHNIHENLKMHFQHLGSGGFFLPFWHSQQFPRPDFLIGSIRKGIREEVWNVQGHNLLQFPFMSILQVMKVHIGIGLKG